MNLFQRVARSLAQWTGLKISDPRSANLLIPFSGPSIGGMPINYDTALRSSPWWRGIALLANSVAMLPLDLLRETPEGIRKEKSHPAARIARRPDRSMTRFTWFQTLMFHALSRGDGLAEIRRAPNGEAVLSFIDPDDTEISWNDDGTAKVYKSRRTGKYYGEVIHVPGLGYDGLRGLPVWHYAAVSLALDLGAERYGANWFDAGGRPAAVLTHPGQMTEEAADRVKREFNEKYKTLSHVMALLQEGMKYEPLDNDPSKAQAPEIRKWQVAVVSRFLGVPPHMLFSFDGAPRASLEQQNREFLIYSLSPWLCVIEQEFEAKLLTDSDRESARFEFDESYLLRCDSEAQSRIDASDVACGKRTVAEVRERDGLPFIPGTDKPRVPLNTGYLDADGNIINPVDSGNPPADPTIGATK